ncbi:rhomboid family intramembrane serine protease [Natranaerobius thermophilus]|uniref:Rhomboid family protein n=1 Tax=Natranaerobius thermophilus (strain ATCC BAA-1301 / DSM 18059 / JW/NM-WN-LF) TaxID=457570 RepID=B2A0H6_NATTJ|nr:rhomboid family intramembrane serine protease [Natranaerobius thermophilus]ACB84537.1 Rhomboid family protein [Natranaerobius thermophilus JW/NM-WN-LF]
MIPLKDNIRSRKLPVMTVGLIILNIWIFFQQTQLPPDQLQLLIAEFGFIPKRIVLAYNQGELSLLPLATPVTSAFFHGNLIHLAGNMLYLWVFGDNVEDKLGSFRFLLFYLVAAIFGSLGHLLSDPLSVQPAIGASGAVAGVLGAYFIFFPYAKVFTLVPIGIFITFIHLPAVIFLGIWILIQGANAALPAPGEAVSVAWWAHISGFIMGVIYSLFKK